jgi:hypothetical protein
MSITENESSLAKHRRSVYQHSYRCRIPVGFRPRRGRSYCTSSPGSGNW